MLHIWYSMNWILPIIKYKDILPQALFINKDIYQNIFTNIFIDKDILVFLTKEIKLI